MNKKEYWKAAQLLRLLLNYGIGTNCWPTSMDPKGVVHICSPESGIPLVMVNENSVLIRRGDVRPFDSIIAQWATELGRRVRYVDNILFRGSRRNSRYWQSAEPDWPVRSQPEYFQSNAAIRSHSMVAQTAQYYENSVNAPMGMVDFNVIVDTYYSGFHEPRLGVRH